ncbi:uncharacterized protein V1518DRAFT_430151 [Limtongia smithiae]|uniref:uncharacterized protein n=1 Tax=Limtongia smithiae TaxID=1125753 RepID=UPI0034CD9485
MRFVVLLLAAASVATAERQLFLDLSTLSSSTDAGHQLLVLSVLSIAMEDHEARHKCVYNLERQYIYDVLSVTSSDRVSVDPISALPPPTYTTGINVDLTLTKIINGTQLYFHGVLAFEDRHVIISQPLKVSKTGKIVYLHNNVVNDYEGYGPPYLFRCNCDCPCYCKDSSRATFVSMLTRILERFRPGAGAKSAPVLPTAYAHHYIPADEINTEGTARYQFVDGVYSGRWECELLLTNMYRFCVRSSFWGRVQEEFIEPFIKACKNAWIATVLVACLGGLWTERMIAN